LPHEKKEEVLNSISFIRDTRRNQQMKDIHEHAASKAVVKQRADASRSDTQEDEGGRQLELVRNIFYRLVKQEYVNMAATGQMLAVEGSVALKLAYIVDTAADSPRDPLCDLEIALASFVDQPWVVKMLGPRRLNLPGIQQFVADQLMNYEIEIAGVLLAIVESHLLVQSSINETFSGEHGDVFQDEVDKVIAESTETVERAQKVLGLMSKPVDGQNNMTALQQAVQVKQSASYLIAKIEEYIKKLAASGAAEEGDQHHLMHTVEHDQAHVLKDYRKTIARVIEMLTPDIVAKRVLHCKQILTTQLEEVKAKASAAKVNGAYAA